MSMHPSPAWRRWIAGTCLLNVLLVGGGCLTRKSGEELVRERCTKCHTLFLIETAGKTRQDWMRTVSRMVHRGAQLNTQEIGSVVDYLTHAFGPEKTE
jgi:hypothetical protein